MLLKKCTRVMLPHQSVSGIPSLLRTWRENHSPALPRVELLDACKVSVNATADSGNFDEALSIEMIKVMANVPRPLRPAMSQMASVVQNINTLQVLVWFYSL